VGRQDLADFRPSSFASMGAIHLLGTLCLFASIYRWKWHSKKFKKSEKKACQPFRASIKPVAAVTNRPNQPFKKSLKKVKKKLVSALEI
jgi:hypothetical protein